MYLEEHKSLDLELAVCGSWLIHNFIVGTEFFSSALVLGS